MTFKKWKDMLNNPNYPIKERMFILIASVALLAIIVALVIRLIIGATRLELLIMTSALIVFGMIVILSLKHDKVFIGARITGTLMVFALLPIMFFTFGGVYSGTPLWFLFCTLFITLTLSGPYMWFLLISDAIVGVSCFILTFTHPSLEGFHSRATEYVDVGTALLMVTTLIVMMLRFVGKVHADLIQKTEEQKKEIQEMSAAQNRFFSSMSHEIRTPINTIIGLNEMILREDISDEVAEDAANIQDASKMLLHTINDILDMSKIQAGQLDVTPVTYRTGDMLSGIVGMHWLKAKEKGLLFHTSVAPDVPSELYGDEIRIKQILINLLNNAIKYTANGSVSLSIQCEKIDKENIRMIYTVSDTGMGIRKESIPYLFSAFRRVDEEKNRYIEGTGLGLSIVKRLVDLMDGTITVNSIYTRGSTFVVEIPQKVVNSEAIGDLDMDKRQNMKERVVYHQSFTAPDARVLVVDDNASNLLVVTKLLRDTKVQLETVTSGADALMKTLATEYQVIFMDHMMPEMDGIECLHKLRSQTGGLCKEAKVVAFTANAGSENKELYQKEGFDGYLTKPISGEALENELGRLLPKELVHFTKAKKDVLEESMQWINNRRKKAAVVVTTESVADLPKNLIEQHHIVILPHSVKTSEGMFRDGVDIETKGFLAYMRDETRTATVVTPSAETYELFYAKQLERANHVIHISSSSLLEGTAYPAAVEAARAFDNVSVVDSWQLSGGVGMLTLMASHLAEEGKSAVEILATLKKQREKIHTSFIIRNLDYLARSNTVSKRVAYITRAFLSHPTIKVKKGKTVAGKSCHGSMERSWRSYIKETLDVTEEIDKSMVIVLYSGITMEDRDFIRGELAGRIHFNQVIFQQASVTIACFFGEGTIGLVFMTR